MVVQRVGLVGNLVGDRAFDVFVDEADVEDAESFGGEQPRQQLRVVRVVVVREVDHGATSHRAAATQLLSQQTKHRQRRV